MDNPDFYNDKKYCPACDAYVSYLMSVGHSYCTACGKEVRLFSRSDWESFNHDLGSKKPKSGRKRKTAQRDSA